MKFSLYILPRDARSCGDQREAGAEGRGWWITESTGQQRSLCFLKKNRGFSGWLSVVRRTRKDVDKGHATGTRRLRREDASGWNNWTYWRPVHKAGRKTSRLCQSFQSELSRNKTVIVQQRAECDDSALIQILIVSMLVLVVYRYQRDRINTFCSLSSVWNPLNKLNK